MKKLLLITVVFSLFLVSCGSKTTKMERVNIRDWGVSFEIPTNMTEKGGSKIFDGFNDDFVTSYRNSDAIIAISRVLVDSINYDKESNDFTETIINGLKCKYHTNDDSSFFCSFMTDTYEYNLVISKNLDPHQIMNSFKKE